MLSGRRYHVKAVMMVPKKACAWVAEQSSDEGLKASAKLRLAGVLMDQKNYDEASLNFQAVFPPEFLVRCGRSQQMCWQLQEKRPEAIAEYTKAYKGFEDSVEYRRLVEIKLNALGVTLQGVTVATAANRNPCRVQITMTSPINTRSRHLFLFGAVGGICGHHVGWMLFVECRLQQNRCLRPWRQCGCPG